MADGLQNEEKTTMIDQTARIRFGGMLAALIGLCALMAAWAAPAEATSEPGVHEFSIVASTSQAGGHPLEALLPKMEREEWQ